MGSDPVAVGVASGYNLHGRDAQLRHSRPENGTGRRSLDGADVFDLWDCGTQEEREAV